MLLRLLLAMNMSVEEIQHALRLYPMPVLDENDPRDLLIASVVRTSRRVDLYETDRLLRSADLEALLPDED